MSEGRGAVRLASVAVTATVAVVGLDVAAHLIGVGFGVGNGLLNADGDSGIFGWVAVVALAAAVSATLVLALRRSEQRALLVLLAAALAFIIVSSRVHLRDHLHAWPAVYVPVLLGIALLLLTATVRGTPGRRLALAGLGVLAVSLAIHELGPPLLRQVGWGPGDWGYEVKVALKGALELGGWMLVAAALVYAAATTVAASSSRSRGFRLSGVRPRVARNSSAPNSPGEPMKRTLPIDSR
jgi:hypothetical protein